VGVKFVAAQPVNPFSLGVVKRFHVVSEAVEISS
jgi:hypothetical protein